MEKGITAGALPDDLDERLTRRDTTPLPAGALLRLQVINRGKNPIPNYRWLLYDDGRLFLARHSGDTSDPRTPFDTPLPDRPTRTLDQARVEQVRQRLAADGFSRQPPYQADPRVDDGAFTVVTARLDGGVHEVIYDAYAPPLVEFLKGLTPA